MIFAAVTSDTVIQGFGLQSGIVILALAGVVLYLFRGLQKSQDKFDALQERRLEDAKETRDKLTEPLNEQAKQSQKIYELLVSVLNDRK